MRNKDRGTKTITFDFPILYPVDGQYLETNKITVNSPGLGKYDVYSTMKSYVGKAMLNMSKARAGIKSDEELKIALQDDDEAPAQDAGEDEDRDVMIIMAMGLSTEDYPKFATYVQKVLTGSPRLATVGDEKCAITDEVWTSIEENGGMEAVNRVMSEFVGFFFDALPSPKKSGRSKSPTSSSQPRPPSQTQNTSKTSRGKT